jgi:hypothetical protein
MRMDFEDPADTAKSLNTMIPAPRFPTSLPMLPSVSIRAIRGQNSLRFPSVVIHRGPGQRETGEVLAETVGISGLFATQPGGAEQCP